MIAVPIPMTKKLTGEAIASTRCTQNHQNYKLDIKIQKLKHESREKSPCLSAISTNAYEHYKAIEDDKRES